jgi:hypothetical protein
MGCTGVLNGGGPIQRDDDPARSPDAGRDDDDDQDDGDDDGQNHDDGDGDNGGDGDTGDGDTGDGDGDTGDGDGDTGDGDGDGDTGDGDGDTGDGDGDATPDAAVPEPPPMRVDGIDETRALFDGTWVYFNPDDRRQIDQDVNLPEDMYQYREIRLAFALRCPQGGCDPWDRHGHISIMADVKGEKRELELMRFVTPYGRDMTFEIDVTDLRPILTGRVTARVFIDTWVGPGNNPSGPGWLVDAHLKFKGGTPPHDVLAVMPLWSPGGVTYGDPGRSPKRELKLDLPQGARGAQMFTIITGHGQGNHENCAEFCPKYHTLRVGDREFKRVIWRDNCATTAVPNQGGNWKPSRAGWCPGAGVEPWVEDVSAGVSAGASNLTVSWTPEDFTNTCRPKANPCADCVFNTSCEYDGGNHTEPYYQLSGMMVITR